MTIKQALKNLYTAMCGGTTTKDGTAAIIGDIADNYTGGGGSDLPEPGASGNVLTSNGTSWGSAAPQAADYIVDIVDDGHDGITAEHDGEAVTAAQIIAAKKAGKNVIAHYQPMEGMLFVGYLSFYMEAVSSVVFECNYYDAVDTFNGTTVYIYGYASEQEDRWEQVERILMPLAASSHNGFGLKIVDGDWTLVKYNEPLVITGTSSGSTFTVDNGVTAEEIITALAEHRPVYIDPDSGGRCYYQWGGYTSASAYTYDFLSWMETSGKLTAVRITFDNSMTGVITTMNFTPDA